MKIKLLIKKIKYKIVKFLYNYFKKIYIRNINIDDNEILQYAHNELTIYGYNNDVFETKDGVLTGRYFNTCYIKECQIKSGYYIPFNTIKLKGVKVEIKEFISIMTIDCENSDLIRLSNLYDIDWKTTNDFKNKHINDITVKSYNNYIKNNKQ